VASQTFLALRIETFADEFFTRMAAVKTESTEILVMQR
jgi:hypothetical protein